MLNCSVWFSAPSLWMDDGLESRCILHVYGADSAMHRTALSAPTQQLSRPSSIHKLGAENHTLQFNI
jgi:hypothetical protein